MKDKLTIVFSWVLVLITMLIIFNFSAQPGKQSSAMSEGAVVQILGIVMDKEEITPPVISKFQLPIRKLAHFGIYMLLGFCMISAFEKTFKIKLWLNAVLSELACVLYATSDEFHQSFSENRGPSVVDVLIDSSGAIVGILMFLGVLFLYNKSLKKSRVQ